jgi:hypothetical protein
VASISKILFSSPFLLCTDVVNTVHILVEVILKEFVSFPILCFMQRKWSKCDENCSICSLELCCL